MTQQDDRFNANVGEVLAKFANKRIENDGFSRSEYIRHVIRQDREIVKQKEINLLNDLIAKSKASGIAPESPEELRAGARKIVERVVASKTK